MVKIPWPTSGFRGERDPERNNPTAGSWKGQGKNTLESLRVLVTVLLHEETP